MNKFDAVKQVPLSPEEVEAVLDEYGDPAAAEQFKAVQMAYEPVNGELDPDRVLYAPCAAPGGEFIAFAFTVAFEEGDGDDEGGYATHWRAAYGPMSLDELKELASGPQGQ